MRKLLLALLLLAAPAQATTISSISVAGNTVTVNSTAHGLSAALPSAFCITGSSVAVDNVCGVVVTATANALTFTASGLANCAATCGTVVAAPRIIILSTPQTAEGVLVNFLLWTATTNGIAATNASAWKMGGASSGPTSAQLNLLASGGLIERGDSQIFPTGTTTAAIQAFLQNKWTTEQTRQSNGIQPGAFYGQGWDGTSWAQQ